MTAPRPDLAEIDALLRCAEETSIDGDAYELAEEAASRLRAMLAAETERAEKAEADLADTKEAHETTAEQYHMALYTLTASQAEIRALRQELEGQAEDSPE